MHSFQSVGEWRSLASHAWLQAATRVFSPRAALAPWQASSSQVQAADASISCLSLHAPFSRPHFLPRMADSASLRPRPAILRLSFGSSESREFLFGRSSAIPCFSKEALVCVSFASRLLGKAADGKSLGCEKLSSSLDAHSPTSSRLLPMGRRNTFPPAGNA